MQAHHKGTKVSKRHITIHHACRRSPSSSVGKRGRLSLWGLQSHSTPKYILSSSLVFTLAFITTFLAVSVLTPEDSTHADTLNGTLNGTDYYVNITSAGTINMNLESTPDGSMAIAKDTLNVKTNSYSGYKLYLSTDKTATQDANGNRLYRQSANGESTSAFISPHSASANSPAALDNNSWGYAIPSAPFDDTYTETTSTNASSATAAKFAAVPPQRRRTTHPHR